MTPSRIALAALAVAFGIAELARPTRVVLPKRTVAGGLVLRSQGTYRGTAATLDPELLDDLPRIHPDALGELATIQLPSGDLELRGWIGDPSAHAAGIAIFPLVAGRRLPGARTIYGLLRPAVEAPYGAGLAPTGFRIALPAGAVPSGAHVAVGLIAADRRGYFLLSPDVAGSRANGTRR